MTLVIGAYDCPYLLWIGLTYLYRCRNLKSTLPRFCLLAEALLPSEYVVGGTGNRVRVLHMGIPKGNVQPFIVRGRHIAIGTNPTHICTLQVPIGNRHAPRGFRQTNKPNRGTIRPVWDHPTIDPIGAVP